MSRCEPMSQGLCRPVLRCCVNYGASAVSVEAHSPVARVVTCFVSTGLPQLDPVGIPAHLLQRLQSVMNAAAWLIFQSSKFDHVTPVLRQLHWLKVRERIDFKLAVLVYKCLHGLALPYLIDELCQPADLKAQQRLRSASSLSLIVRRNRLSTVGRVQPNSQFHCCDIFREIGLLQ